MGRVTVGHERLGGLGSYAEFRSPATLARWVDRLWWYRAPSEPSEAEHRVLPHTGTSLCFRYMLTESGVAEDGEVLLIGPVRHPRLFKPIPGEVMESVQLKPEWVGLLIGVNPMEHVDRLSVRAFSGSELRRIESAARASIRAGGSALPGLLGWLEERAGRSHSDSAAWVATQALERIRAMDVCGRVRVGRLAKELGVSNRHLRRCVVDRAGMSPKYLLRLQRLNGVIAFADSCERPAWSRLAASHGFCDQAHLIQDVRELTGCTPSQLHAERRSEHVRFFQSGATPSS